MSPICVATRFTVRSGVRALASVMLALIVVLQTGSIAFADTTTGVLSGTIRSAQTSAPIAGATVSVASPSASRSTKTDARGFFSITGVSPDTYTVSVSASGYADVVTPGVTVNAQQATTFSPTLSATLRTIGRSVSRSQTSAFQPLQTQDTYTVNQTQINTILGDQFNTNETTLITSLPGASLDINGYPVIRGGRENEEGFEFDGIDYTDAFQSQFTNSLALNGQSSFQLTPGAGDASVGNAGTGALNIIAKKGAYPAFGTLDLEVGSPAFNHQLGLEYGFASPNGRISDFVSLIDARNASIVGYRTSDLVEIGQPVAGTYNSSNDIVNNFIYKFGRQNSEQLQFLYQNQAFTFYQQAAPGTQFAYRSNDPVAQNYYGPGTTALGPDSLSSIYGFTLGQKSANELLAASNRNPEVYYQPSETFKFQYSNNLSESTFLTAKFYRVQSVTTFDFPYNYSESGGAFFGDFNELEGGARTGVTLDVTKQFGTKNLVTIGSRYDFLHPVYTSESASAGIGSVAFQSGANGQALIYDFLPAANADCVASGLTCGYLSNYFPKGIPRVPLYNNTTTSNRQDFAYYINDAFSATNRLKIEAGVRVDSTNIQLPTVSSDAYLPKSGGGYSSGYYLPISTGTDANGNPDPSKDVYDTGGNATRHPQVFEPRLAAAFQVRPTDSVRVSYGRSAELVPLGDVDHTVPRSAFVAFAGIPATASVCGPTGDRACRDYADELYWANTNQGSGVPIQPAKPATFNNYDFSYSHDFGHGVALKVNPFYRRGYDGLALVSTPRIGSNGQPLLNPDGSTQLNPAITTNNGISRTSGIEFYVTKEARFGLSGSFSATYINEFSNVIPGSGNEDFFPSIPLPSLQLGNLYRVGFISPLSVTVAAAYKTRGGFKISPNILFNRGYPYGSGNITAIDVNGVPQNVPQTNVSFGTTVGSQQATNYVDPQNPGSVFAPNIAATRGTPEGASAGAYLTRPRARVDLDIEFSRPNSRSTFGVQIFNVFNNVYSQPSLNSYYQPVATGLAGPATGTYPLVPQFGPTLGFANYGSDRFGSDAYTISPTNSPTAYQFYYQLKL